MDKIMIRSIFFVLLISGCLNQQPAEISDVKQSVESTTIKKEKVLKEYTLDEVSNHNNVDDCWIALSEKVYDVTDFIALEKHGKAIEQGCGTDGTELYETRPMESGTPDSDNARGLAKKYLIGTLTDSEPNVQITTSMAKQTTTLSQTISTTVPLTTSSSTSTLTVEEDPGITTDDVSSHDDRSSCWTIVDGKVYDLTSFVSKHKGGTGNILKLCGKDGSATFRGKHKMSKDGVLKGFYIGDIN